MKTSAPAHSSRPRRYRATPRLTSASVRPPGADRPPEKAAVAWIQDDAAVLQGRQVAARELFLEGLVAGNFHDRRVRRRTRRSRQARSQARASQVDEDEDRFTRIRFPAGVD